MQNQAPSQHQARQLAQKTANKIYFAFPSFQFVDSDDITPVAAVNKRTGHLLINRNFWKTLRLEYKIFILCHEEAHYIFKDSDEFRTDERAFKKYASLGYSLKDAVNALHNVLDRDNLVHNYRVYLQLQRALEHDYKHYNNQQAFRPKYLNILQAKKQLINSNY